MHLWVLGCGCACVCVHAHASKCALVCQRVCVGASRMCECACCVGVMCKEYNIILFFRLWLECYWSYKVQCAYPCQWDRTTEMATVTITIIVTSVTLTTRCWWAGRPRPTNTESPSLTVGGCWWPSHPPLTLSMQEAECTPAEWLT